MNYIQKTLKIILSLAIIATTSCAKDEDSLMDLDTGDTIANSSSTRSTVPCAFGLDDIKGSSTVSIDCVVDLGGKTIDLEPNVNFDFNNGDIINGTLNFNGGIIDGRLLNNTLTIKGDAQLKADNFEFIPEQWGVVEGNVTREQALVNRVNFENALESVSDIGGTTFEIDDFDAFFNVSDYAVPNTPFFYPGQEAINIPGDFNLVMSDNTHIRTYPNARSQFVLMSIEDVKNVNVTGGNLYGDRDEHDYSSGESHERGHCLQVRGAQNINVTGTTMKDGVGDGLLITGIKFTFEPDYNPSRNVTINECTFDGNRRNNLTIGDGYDLIVENSLFLRAGVDTPYSQGANPRHAIDIEADRRRDANGNLVFYQKVDGVIIRNNVEREGGRGGFICSIGDNVTFEGNDMQRSISYKLASGTRIKNNTFTYDPNFHADVAVIGGSSRTTTISDNEVSGNTITGYNSGIRIYGANHDVYENEIFNCTIGLTGNDVKNTKYRNNLVQSASQLDRGIAFNSTTLDQVEFTGNTIDVGNEPIRFTGINMGTGQELFCANLIDNDIISEKYGILSSANGISLLENRISTGTRIYNSLNFFIKDNIIVAGNMHGIDFLAENSNVRVLANDIGVNDAYECVRIASTTDEGEIMFDGNSCVD